MVIVMPEKYEPDSIEQGRRELITWDQIVTCANVLPELETAAHEEIRRHMGYLPEPSAYMNHEVFIRTLIDQHRKRQISDETFFYEVESHAKQIRNADVVQGGYIDNVGPYTELDMQRYNTHYIQYAEKARQRLKFLLKADYELIYTLYAELLIRQLCAQDWYMDGMPPTAPDFKAITIIHYRKATIVAGKDFADTIPVLGLARP